MRIMTFRAGAVARERTGPDESTLASRQWYRFRIESHSGLFQSAIRLIFKLRLIQRNAFIVAKIDDGHESTRGNLQWR
jgi:hypothetical protein